MERVSRMSFYMQICTNPGNALVFFNHVDFNDLNSFISYILTNSYDHARLTDARLICFLGTFIIVFFVPETKGKSPEEMKAYFEKKTVKSGKR